MTEVIRNDYNQLIGYPVAHWSARSHPSRSTMQGKYCRLEALDADLHSDSLYASLGKNPVTDWTYLPYGPFEKITDFNAWLALQSTRTDPFFYVIVDMVSGESRGLASYLRIDTSGGVIEVGHIHYAESIQRTPLATEAMFLMMQRVFDELGYRRYEWKCDVLNERSRIAAVRLGFTFEGVFRQATMYKNRNRDTAWYSIIDTEWPRLKQAYEAWLSSDNFDSSGSKLVRLGELTK